jgi:hypothetical protein
VGNFGHEEPVPLITTVNVSLTARKVNSSSVSLGSYILSPTYKQCDSIQTVLLWDMILNKADTIGLEELSAFIFRVLLVST